MLKVNGKKMSYRADTNRASILTLVIAMLAATHAKPNEPDISPSTASSRHEIIKQLLPREPRRRLTWLSFENLPKRARLCES